MIQKNPRYAKIGVFAVVHATYWGQFEGLYDNIMKYHSDFIDQVRKNKVDDVLECYNTVTEAEIQEKIRVIDPEFDMPDPVLDQVTTRLTDEDKYQAAKSAVALDKFVEKYNLTGLVYYYEGGAESLHRKIATTFIVGNSILNAEGIPMCGEYDIKPVLQCLV